MSSTQLLHCLLLYLDKLKISIFLNTFQQIHSILSFKQYLKKTLKFELLICTSTQTSFLIFKTVFPIGPLLKVIETIDTLVSWYRNLQTRFVQSVSIAITFLRNCSLSKITIETDLFKLTNYIDLVLNQTFLSVEYFPHSYCIFFSNECYLACRILYKLVITNATSMQVYTWIISVSLDLHEHRSYKSPEGPSPKMYNKPLKNLLLKKKRRTVTKTVMGESIITEALESFK